MLNPGKLDGRKAELNTYFAGVTEWAMDSGIDLLNARDEDWGQVSDFLTASPMAN